MGKVGEEYFSHCESPSVRDPLKLPRRNRAV
jgi:hypothetical protein